MPTAPPAPIRTALVGAGMRGCGLAGLLRKCADFSLAAIVDPIRSRGELAAREYGGDVPILPDLAACLGTIDTDAVVLATPDFTHAQLACAALAAGKWVFIEKPLEITSSQAQRIIDADDSAGGRTFVGFNLRYAPLYATIHDLIAQGIAGRVLSIQADEYYDGGRTYFRRWNRLRQFSGGLWVTKACHDFDLLYWLAGARPIGVYAACGVEHYKPRADAAAHCRDCSLAHDCQDAYERHVRPGTLWHSLNQLTEAATGQRPDLCLFNSDKDTFDHGAATVTFANGVIATYTLSVVAGFTNRTIRVNGTLATIDGDLEASAVTIRHRDAARTQVVQIGAGTAAHSGGDERLFPSFASFIRGRAVRFVSPRESAVAIQIGLAATRSCDEQCFVRL